MLASTIIILHVLAVQAHEKQVLAIHGSQPQGSTDNAAGMLGSRALKVQSLHCTGMDDTLLGKPGHLEVAPRAPAALSLPSPGALHGSTRSPLSRPGMVPVQGLTAMPGMAPPRRSLLSICPRAIEPFHGASHSSSVSQFRQWPLQRKTLVDYGLQTVTGERAIRLMRIENALLVDVRPPGMTNMMMGNGARVHMGKPKGAVNVPLFVPNKGNSMRDMLKRVVNAVGLRRQAVERNTEFVREVAAVALDEFGNNRTIILACNRGGSIEGRGSYVEPEYYTQSLQAAYELVKARFPKVFILRGGISQWVNDELPVDDSDDKDRDGVARQDEKQLANGR